MSRVKAPWAWSQGYTGQGIVVAGQDTGYAWDHPALINAYRGYNAATGTADHDYNWHDSIHGDIGNPNPGGTNPCGYDSPVPCDDYGHGTHTMGTMAGNDLAPGSSRMACRRDQRHRRRARRQMDRLPQHGSGRRHPGHLHRMLRMVYRALPGDGDAGARRSEQGARRDGQLVGLSFIGGLHDANPGHHRARAERCRCRGHRGGGLGRQQRVGVRDDLEPAGHLPARLRGGVNQIPPMAWPPPAAGARSPTPGKRTPSRISARRA